MGERGPAPKCTPTYPELCCHSLEDLRILDSRERTPFGVSKKVKGIYESEIIPYWTGKTMREKVFNHMTPAWQEAFDAAVFTEFKHIGGADAEISVGRTDDDIVIHNSH